MPTLSEHLETFRRGVEREWRFILATFAASGIGYLGSAAAPVMVNALIEGGVSHQQAGDLGTIELTTLALSTMLITPVVAYVSHRKLALGGVAVAATGLLISALSSGYAAMAIGRVIIGAGSGLAISGANATVAAREDAERIFAIIWTMGGAITATLTINLPKVVAGGDYAMGFGVLLLLSLVAAPLIAWIPHRPPELGVGAGAGPAAVSAEAPVGRFGPFGRSALLILAAVFIYSVAEQALWQFSMELAVDAGIPSDEVRWIVGFTVLMGLAGGAIAAVLGLRLGRVFPVVIGSLFSAAGRWLYISAADSAMLWVGGLLWGLGFYFVSPYQIGLAAAIDRRGRVAVASGGLMNLGYGLGPSVGGRIRQYQVDNDLDHSMLVVVIAGATLVSMLLLLPVAMRLDRALRAAPDTEPSLALRGSRAADAESPSVD